MQLAFSPHAEFSVLAVVNAIVLRVTNAQGPVPSPLISGPSPPPANVPVVAPQPNAAPELTKADFEAFLDALIPSQLRNRKIDGTVVSVVKDGQVNFSFAFTQFFYQLAESHSECLPGNTIFSMHR